LVEMKKVTVPLILMLAGAIISCSVVPITGRKQISLIPESEMIAMGLSSYQEFMKGNSSSSDKINSAIVKEVGTSISSAVEFYFAANGLESRLEGYKWEYSLVDDKVPNAFCLPGGKVVVNSGILPYTADKNGLAVVVSHEIAHAVARHGNERMSQQLLLQLGGVALSEAVKNKPEETKNIYTSVYGIGSQLGVMLPYSREHELEADKLGLIFMAMAGYDPQTAVGFWERMSTIGGDKPPEFMSTHPSDARRISKIKEAMPEILKYYKKI
jgi:predicted Zn-dependent protease